MYSYKEPDALDGQKLVRKNTNKVARQIQGKLARHI